MNKKWSHFFLKAHIQDHNSLSLIEINRASYGKTICVPPSLSNILGSIFLVKIIKITISFQVLCIKKRRGDVIKSAPMLYRIID